MGADLTGRHFLSILDLTREEILGVLDRARELKAGGYPPAEQPLKGKTLAMIFQKPSLRTRVSFETGMTRLGGHAIYLAPTDISLGKRETTEDIAIVLSRYADIIMARVFGHDIVDELAAHATVPVINGLSDHEHPCQILADFQTIIERRGKLAGVKACYIGDGNNVCNSLMLGAARVGMHFTAITPSQYEPRPDVVTAALAVASATRAQINVSNDLSAVRGMEVIYTDVWASMGQESEAEARKRVFKDYRIDAKAMKLAADDATILHCLPAHYGDEIDYDTSRMPNSAIFDQAENRMHAQNALLCCMLAADAPVGVPGVRSGAAATVRPTTPPPGPTVRPMVKPVIKQATAKPPPRKPAPQPKAKAVKPKVVKAKAAKAKAIPVRPKTKPSKKARGSKPTVASRR